MGRIIVLLTFAGLAGVFLIIYNAGKPVQSATPYNSNGTANGNKRSTKETQAEKKANAQSHRRAAEKSRNYASKPSNDDQTVDAPATDPKRRPTTSGADPLLTVNSDSAVYSANSRRSKVLRVLRKGEKVRPDLEVLDSTGRWRIVRGQPKDKPGFVLEEQIERPPADASRNKSSSQEPKQF